METSKVYLKRSDYSTLEDLMTEINGQVNYLISKNYACSVYRSLVNDNVYVIEFASMDPLLNEEFSMPFWITPVEASAIAKMRRSLKKDNSNVSDLEDFSGDDNGGHYGQA